MVSNSDPMTMSVVTNLEVIRVKFEYHQFRATCALIIFIGSGLTARNREDRAVGHGDDP